MLFRSLARLEAAFAAIPAEDDSLGPLVDRLQLVLDNHRRSAAAAGAAWSGAEPAQAAESVADALGSATDDEIFAFIDREL